MLIISKSEKKRKLSYEHHVDLLQLLFCYKLLHCIKLARVTRLK